MTQTANTFLPTWIPAHRSTLTSNMAAPLGREADAYLIKLPYWLESTNRRFVSRRQDHFVGVGPPKFKRPFPFADFISADVHPFRPPFHRRGWPIGPWDFALKIDRDEISLPVR